MRGSHRLLPIYDSRNASLRKSNQNLYFKLDCVRNSWESTIMYSGRWWDGAVKEREREGGGDGEGQGKGERLALLVDMAGYRYTYPMQRHSQSSGCFIVANCCDRKILWQLSISLPWKLLKNNWRILQEVCKRSFDFLFLRKEGKLDNYRYFIWTLSVLAELLWE